MAIALDSSTHYQYTPYDTTVTYTYAHTVSGSNRILWVGACTHTTKTITGVTYNGVSMTKATDKTSGAYISLWYLIAPDTGTNNVVVTTDGGIGRFNSDCASYTGVKQSAQPDATNTGGPTNTSSYSQALTTVANNSWSIANIIGEAAASLTAGTNTAILFNLEATAFGNGLIHSGTDLATGSNPLAVTSTAQNQYSIIASFAPATAAANNSTFLAFM